MTNELALPSPNTILLPEAANANQRKRLLPFIRQLDNGALHWLDARLADILEAYRDELFDRGLTPQSVNAYLTSIRSRYNELLNQPAIRDLLFAEYLSMPEALRAGLSMKEYTDERINRLQSAIDPKTVSVKVPKKGDQQHIRLSKDEAQALLNATDLEPNTLRRLRDRALIATMLCTGVRAFELVNIQRPHLYDHYEGYPALYIPSGKGLKERRVVYGGLIWFRPDVERWMQVAGITEGYVFRRVFNNDVVGSEPLTTQAVSDVLDKYPILISGNSATVDPHDLRRTFARRCFEGGMQVEGIRDNLGHEDVRTTYRYIGDMDAGRRLPPQGVY